MLATTVLVACGEAQRGENHLSYAGDALQVERVSCLQRLGRINVDFAGGQLFVTPRDEAPEFRAVLRFQDLERGSHSNRDLEGTDTGGLDVELGSGVSGTVMMMREAYLMNPDRYPDATAQPLEMRLYCPED